MANYKKQFNKAVAREGFAINLQCMTNGVECSICSTSVGLRMASVMRHILPVVIHWLLCIYENKRLFRAIHRI